MVAAASWLGARVVASSAHVARPAGLVAIERLHLTMPSHPPPLQWNDAYGDVLALLLGDIDGVKAVGPTYLLGANALREAHDAPLAPQAWRDAETKASARYVVRASIEEDSAASRSRSACLVRRHASPRAVPVVGSRLALPVRALIHCAGGAGGAGGAAAGPPGG
ncbi:MAG TPA: hypothetical protein VGF94_10655 [Kofleriaceae bacterium]